MIKIMESFEVYKSEVLKTVDKNIQYLVRNEMVGKLSVVIGIQ